VESELVDQGRASAAAHAHPAFRRLYPYTSHSTLHFSAPAHYPFSPDIVCLDVAQDPSARELVQDPVFRDPGGPRVYVVGGATRCTTRT
jgi:Family of unknown function (DUF6193)